ncbi:uncharacterized protein [Epargyreus clarus]|uniref:uncharacterized protein n=1 Tax=Epargyreus clarus TaxID=520877 RepID=UPI003C2E819D
MNGYRIEDYPEYGNEPMRHFEQQKNTEDYNQYVDDFNECRCSCNTCIDIQPCCRNQCANCATPQSNVMFVPYAYPIIVTKDNKDSDKKDKETTVTTTSTTFTTTTATTKVETTTETITIPENKPEARFMLPDTEKIDIENNIASIPNNPRTLTSDVAKGPYELLDRNSKYVMTSIRRTKTNWLPKYGIVPIPDQLAEKILLQLRNMKVLHPTHNNMRPMDFLNKYKN